jgi:hypothetical protein
MQAAQNISVHGPAKLYPYRSHNLSSHQYQKYALSFSPGYEKLKKILTRTRESLEWGNNST